jgi:hypothetical protein
MSFRMLAILVAIAPFFPSAAAAEANAAVPAPPSVRSAGNCSPIIIDTRGNVTLNINCPSYVGTRLQARLRSAEVLLKREQPLPPVFMRPTGPIWSELESGFHPFASETVSSIAAALDRNRFHAIVGEFTAWREQFVRFLGWSLATKNNSVFFSDVREWTTGDQIEIDWGDLDQSSTVILLENVHYHPDMVRDFLYQVESRTTRLKIIVSFEPTIRAFLERRPYSEDLFVSMPQTQIGSAAIGENLVRRYADLVLHRPVGPRVTAAFLKLGQNEQLNTDDYFFPRAQDAGINVWRIAASLREWDGSSLPDVEAKDGPTVAALDETIASIVSSDIELASFLATVAIFSRYEVAVPRAFFIEKLKFKPGILTAALERGLVSVVETGLILNLPGMSDVLLSAAARNKEVELEIARRLGSPDIGNALVSEAIAFGIYDYGALLLNLGARSPAVWTVKRAEAFGAVAKLITTDMSPGRVGRALVALRAVSDRAHSASRSLLFSNPDSGEGGPLFLQTLKPRIGELLALREPLKETAWLILGLWQTDRAVAANEVRGLQVPSIVERISGEEDLGKIGSFLWALDKANHASATHVVDSLDRDWIRSRIDAERSPAKIGWFLEVLTSIVPDVAAEVADGVSAESLRKFDQTTATGDLASFMWGLSTASLPKAQKVFSTLEISELEIRVREERRSRGLGLLLLAAARVNPGLSVKLVDLIGVEQFQKRIEAENNAVDRALLVAGISATPSKTSEIIIRSHAEQLKHGIDHYRQQVIMFSTMCPWCMAAAGERQEREEQLYDASTYFVAAYGVTSTPIGKDLDLQQLQRFRQYEPDRLARAIRTELWERVVRSYERAPAEDKEEFARILYESDLERFRSWVISTVRTSSDAHPLLMWYNFEPEKVKAFIQSHWARATALYTETKSVETPKLAGVLHDSNPTTFRVWLKDSPTEQRSNPLPVSLTYNLDSVELTPATAAWIRTLRRIDPESAQAFFHGATPADLNMVFKKILPRGIPLAQSLMREERGSTGEIRTNINTLSEAAGFLNLALAYIPQESVRIRVAGQSIDKLRRAPSLIAQALPCDGHANPAVDVKGVRALLKRLHFFSALSAMKLDSSELMRCFVRLSSWDQTLGTEFARAVGREKLF